MSLNCAMLSHDRQSVIPLPQEKAFFTQSSIKLVLDCSEDGYPGNSSGYWSSQGLIYLSNQRIVFIAQKPNDSLQSLNIPILHLKNWKLEQPWFGANYIEGIVLPVSGGGLLKNGKLRLTFTEGGAIEFTTILQALYERLAETNEMPSHFEPLPTYQSESSSSTAMPEYSQQQSTTSMSLPSQRVADEEDDLPPSYDAIHQS
ncbi:uncharacterized protein BX664DRAFT_327245 [Halteromyces radiatus]|uniref:uncharacterized protein n=1 Tax=Halteromyces radiatus TaxID=101107 RepID=UPI00221EAB18|nr:uncharacterized protein BX664DRAFT_327245 [Halteromyces radiatus]KAI8097777.1 hypothetical protein BX664DRAFT_327245 [Halteromyces radiatus]